MWSFGVAILFFAVSIALRQLEKERCVDKMLITARILARQRDCVFPVAARLDTQTIGAIKHEHWWPVEGLWIVSVRHANFSVGVLGVGFNLPEARAMYRAARPPVSYYEFSTEGDVAFTHWPGGSSTSTHGRCRHIHIRYVWALGNTTGHQTAS